MRNYLAEHRTTEMAANTPEKADFEGDKPSHNYLYRGANWILRHLPVIGKKIQEREEAGAAAYGAMRTQLVGYTVPRIGNGLKYWCSHRN